MKAFLLPIDKQENDNEHLRNLKRAEDYGQTAAVDQHIANFTEFDGHPSQYVTQEAESGEIDTNDGEGEEDSDSRKYILPDSNTTLDGYYNTVSNEPQFDEEGNPLFHDED